MDDGAGERAHCEFATKLSRFVGVFWGRSALLFESVLLCGRWSLFGPSSSHALAWETGLWLMLRFHFSGDGGMIFHSKGRRGSGWAAACE